MITLGQCKPRPAAGDFNKIHHRNLELDIGEVCHCGDSIQIKAAGYFPYHNSIVVSYKRGEDKFFLAARDRCTDISDSKPLLSRYIIINKGCCSNDLIKSCKTTNPNDAWIDLPESLYIGRLLVAGAVRVLIHCDDLDNPITDTPEYTQAKKEGRVTIV